MREIGIDISKAFFENLVIIHAVRKCAQNLENLPRKQLAILFYGRYYIEEVTGLFHSGLRFFVHFATGTRGKKAACLLFALSENLIDIGRGERWINAFSVALGRESSARRTMHKSPS